MLALEGYAINHKRLYRLYREEQLMVLAEARETVEAWRLDYNHCRPHSSLGALTPTAFAALKGQETLPPQEGEITGGLYL